jgi:hypothetical protein
MKSTFKLNSLPIELRLNIWELALPELRVIQILLAEDGHDGARTNAVIPVVLHINSESRQLALKYYDSKITSEIGQFISTFKSMLYTSEVVLL